MRVLPIWKRKDKGTRILTLGGGGGMRVLRVSKKKVKRYFERPTLFVLPIHSCVVLQKLIKKKKTYCTLQDGIERELNFDISLFVSCEIQLPW